MATTSIKLARVKTRAPTTDAEYITAGIHARMLAEQWAKNHLPDTHEYLHDVSLDSRWKSMSNLELGKIAHFSTVSNLNKLGYSGVSANTGHTLGSFYSAVLDKVGTKFPGSTYKMDSGLRGDFRGVKADGEVIRYYLQEIDSLYEKLLAIAAVM
jgi:hypothetical protein